MQMESTSFYKRMGGHAGWLLVVVCLLFMPSAAMAQKHKIIRRAATTNAEKKDTQKKPSTSSKSKTGKSGTKKVTPKKQSSTSKPKTVKSKSSASKSSAMTEQQRILDNLINNMVYVEGGTFTMGATSEQGRDAYDDEKPTHQVTLSSFRIGKYEVTQREWRAVMGSNPSYFKGDNLPVENVSWDDCQKFISKLNQLTGKYFRLPTEAEWEYAARGGNRSRGYKYSGSVNLDNVAWFSDNSGNTTHNVGTKQPNELGLYDMSGNVYEWCQDCYGDYSSSAQINPTGSSSGSFRVIRGGSWYGYAGCCRVSNRDYYAPSYRSINLGLRLAL